MIAARQELNLRPQLERLDRLICWSEGERHRQARRCVWLRVAANRIDPFTGGNPGIKQKIDQEEKEQEHRSAIAPHPDLNDPVDLVRTTIQPLGRTGGGSAPQISLPARTAAKPGLPLILATPKPSEVSSAPGTQANPGRSLTQTGPSSPPYFPEFEDSPIYRFFDTRFTATPDELTTLKLQMPDDIARHMIDGFIGPGPFAQEPVYLGPTGRFTYEMTEYNDLIGYGFGCHQCGSQVPGTDSGSFILDHQLPERLNFGNWTYRFYPHFRKCASKQGGHVTVIRLRLR